VIDLFPVPAGQIKKSLRTIQSRAISKKIPLKYYKYSASSRRTFGEWQELAERNGWVKNNE
jgi:hypothetical protein